MHQQHQMQQFDGQYQGQGEVVYFQGHYLQDQQHLQHQQLQHQQMHQMHQLQQMQMQQQQQLWYQHQEQQQYNHHTQHRVIFPASPHGAHGMNNFPLQQSQQQYFVQGGGTADSNGHEGGSGEGGDSSAAAGFGGVCAARGGEQPRLQPEQASPDAGYWQPPAGRGEQLAEPGPRLAFPPSGRPDHPPEPEAGGGRGRGRDQRKDHRREPGREPRSAPGRGGVRAALPAALPAMPHSCNGAQVRAAGVTASLMAASPAGLACAASESPSATLASLGIGAALPPAAPDVGAASGAALCDAGSLAIASLVVGERSARPDPPAVDVAAIAAASADAVGKGDESADLLGAGAAEGDGGGFEAAVLGSVQPAAGVIFGCTNSTYEECFELAMVGLPRKYMPLVESIVADHTLVFLFNFSDRMLHGVYVATSNGQENISLTAWKGSAPTPKVGQRKEADGDKDDDVGEEMGSPFPAQCSFDIVEEFAPVPESEFKHVLEYTERQRFKFKLSRWQCRDLVEAMTKHDGKLRARRLLGQLKLT